MAALAAAEATMRKMATSVAQSAEYRLRTRDRCDPVCHRVDLVDGGWRPNTRCTRRPPVSILERPLVNAIR
jgi:hypothetical protein